MRDRKRIGIRLAFYFCGLFLMTLGVAISVKSGLGVTPISSVPYTITVITGMDLGVSTFLFSAAAALLQIPVLRGRYRAASLLQIPVSVVFGFFMTAGGRLLALIPEPSGFFLRFCIMLFSTVFVAHGVFLYISAGLIPLPPEGFLLAVSSVSGLSFSTLKVIGDVAMVAISLTACLIVIRRFGSIGIGTAVSAVLVGTEVKLLTTYLGRWRDRLLERDSAQTRTGGGQA